MSKMHTCKAAFNRKFMFLGEDGICSSPFVPWKLILAEPQWDLALNKSTSETAELMPLRLYVFYLRSVTVDPRKYKALK